MTSLIRHTAVWEGTVGLPGYTNLYHSVTDGVAASAASGHAQVREFFSQIVGAIPGEVTVTVDPVYAVLEDVTGELISEGTVASPSQVVQGTNGAGFSSQVGVLVEWVTGVYVGGRKLRGRTYLVPLAGQFDADGTLSSGGLALVTDATEFIWSSAVDFRVWHRPVAGAGGSSEAIIGSVVRDQACVLRSRMR